MDTAKLAELKEFVKGFEGVDIHGKRIRISFFYRGVRCTEVIKGMELTKSNIKFISNKRSVILHEIAIGTFNYIDHFPDSKRATMFSGGATKRIPTVEEAIKAWLAIKELETAPTTYGSYKSKSDCHIIPKWGPYKLDQINQSEFKKWISLDLAELKNKTINEVLIPLRGIYKDAFNDQLIKHNPMQFIENLEVVSDEPDPFTRDEIKRFIEAPTSRPGEVNAFVFNCWSGLRPSELIGLAWEDIDLKNWTVRVKRANVKGKFKVPKTRGSVRTINLIDPAIEIIKDQLARTSMLPAHEIEVTQIDNKSIKKESVRFVFVNSRSQERFANEGTYRDRFFSTHIKRAKIRYRGPGQARHTFASQLLTAGVNERWLANQMGHSSIKMIEKHYGKWMSEEVPDMAKRVSNLLGFENDRSNSDPKKKQINLSD